MTKSISLFTALMAILLLSSFSLQTGNDFIGTYGVPDSDPSQITLTIKADHTFSYQDFSDSNHKINVTGQWTSQGKKVILKSDDSHMDFHNIWSFTENGDVAKSRKGLCFYRICRIEKH